MAEKEPVIVVKKITVVAAGGHGGSWKVAFADFMTALMAFFLLMWLLGQAEDVKKNVSDYFSTPSVIEYNFSNYGVELTLEKLFLDLVNEPLRFFEDFMRPMDYTPNYMALGSKNIVTAALAEQLEDYASDVQVQSDEIVFDIPERHLFEPGSANPKGKFHEVMGRLQGITSGLEDAIVSVDSRVYLNAVRGGDQELGRQLAEHRLNLILNSVDAKLEHESVTLRGRPEALPATRRSDGRPEEGYIKIRIKQKDQLSDGSKPRPLSSAFGNNDENMDVYNNFVKKISDKKPSKNK